MSSNGRGDDGGSKRQDGIVMIKIDSVTLGALSELFINLSAAWLFTGMLVPFSQDQISFQTRIIVLTGDFLLGILCLGIALWLRRLKKKYEH